MIDTFPFGSAQVGLQMIANSNSIITLKTFEAEVSSWHTVVSKDLYTTFSGDNNIKFPVKPFPETVEEFSFNIKTLTTRQNVFALYKKALRELFEAAMKRIDSKKVLEDMIEIVEK